ERRRPEEARRYVGGLLDRVPRARTEAEHAEHQICRGPELHDGRRSGHRDRSHESRCVPVIDRLRYIERLISNQEMNCKMRTLAIDLQPRQGAQAKRATTAIGAFRAFGGASFWIAPDLTARAYRSGPVARDRLSARLAGARE